MDAAESSNSEFGKVRIHKRDYEHNHRLIQDAFLKLMQEGKGRRPTAREIAAETRLTQRTVETHFEDYVVEPIKSPIRVLAPTVENAVWKSAMGGSVNAQKLFFQLFGNWRETSDVRHTNDPDNPLPTSNNTTVINVRQFVEGKGEVTGEQKSTDDTDTNGTTDEREVH